MMAVCVDPAKINEFWPYIKHWIESAVIKGAVSQFSYVEQDVLEGCSLLWLAYDGKEVAAAAVTDLADGICTIVACGGRGLPLFLPCIESLEQYARAEKCTALRIYGRKGWARVLKNYRTKAIILERPL